MKQTIKYGKARLARWSGDQVFTYAHLGHLAGRAVIRSGIVRVR